jgi:glycosyltransferase involved in cell wall biosynthesis
MSTRPVISAIIATYNRAALVTQAVESVLTQAYRPLEVIVVDDGSTDDTARALARYGDAVRYVYQENRGPAAARNRGIAEASGEVFAFLDADDLWHPEKLRKQWEVLAANPQAGLVHTDVDYWDELRKTKYRRTGPRPDGQGACYPRFFWRNPVTLSTVLLRRSCLQQVGGFDEAIRRPSTEDYDLWFRIARHFPFAYLDEPLVTYRLHGSNAVNNSLTIRQAELYVVLKALRTDPDLHDLIGRAGVRRRLYDLFFDVGYHRYALGQYREAHPYFWRALGCVPTSRLALLHWLTTFLPTVMINRIRWLKHLWL